MTWESRHIAEWIDRTARDVYAYASDPSNLPAWAPRLGAAVCCVDGRWLVESPMGTLTISFAPPNQHGVLDHDLILPSGETVHNPMRVIAAESGCEVVFTLRRSSHMSDAGLERDAAGVARTCASSRRCSKRGEGVRPRLSSLGPGACSGAARLAQRMPISRGPCRRAGWWPTPAPSGDHVMAR